MKVTIVDDISASLESTEITADAGTPSEKRVVSASGTTQIASTAKAEYEQKKADEAAKPQQSASNNSSSSSGSNNSSSGGLSSSSSSGGSSSGSSSGNSSGSGGNNNASSGTGGSDTTTPQQSSKPTVAAQQIGEWSGSNVLSAAQKAHIDSMVQSWRKGGYTDSGLSDAILAYFNEQGISTSFGGVYNKSSFLATSLDEAKATQAASQDSSCVYCYHASRTEGEYDGDYLICYEWDVAFNQ